MFVACEADEDISYLIQYIGEDHLITGSDYGHNNPAEQAQLIASMEAREDIAAALKDKILRKKRETFMGYSHDSRRPEFLSETSGSYLLFGTLHILEINSTGAKTSNLIWRACLIIEKQSRMNESNEPKIV